MGGFQIPPRPIVGSEHPFLGERFDLDFSSVGFEKEGVVKILLENWWSRLPTVEEPPMAEAW